MAHPPLRGMVREEANAVSAAYPLPLAVALRALASDLPRKGRGKEKGYAAAFDLSGAVIAPEPLISAICAAL
jgi:hypothetical protein